MWCTLCGRAGGVWIWLHGPAGYCVAQRVCGDCCALVAAVDDALRGVDAR